jgi:hypothetical protein
MRSLTNERNLYARSVAIANLAAEAAELADLRFLAEISVFENFSGKSLVWRTLATEGDLLAIY